MKKVIIVLSVIMGMLFISHPAMAAKKGAMIEFKETTYNFGTIPEKKGVVSHEFVFTNAGDKPLVIIDATAECGCTTPEYPQAPIQPGNTGIIKVTYNPLGRPGGFTKRVTVKTNGKPRKSFIYVKGVVNPNK